MTQIVVLVSEPVRGRSRATELPCLFNFLSNIMSRVVIDRRDIMFLGCLCVRMSFFDGYHFVLGISRRMITIGLR